jgi:hypothetical protein
VAEANDSELPMTVIKPSAAAVASSVSLSASFAFDRQSDNQNQDGQRRDIQRRTKPMKLFTGGVEGLALALQLMHQSSVSPIEPRVKYTDDNKQEPADVLNGSGPDRFHVG